MNINDYLGTNLYLTQGKYLLDVYYFENRLIYHIVPKRNKQSDAM